jgi:hypothetical protein
MEAERPIRRYPCMRPGPFGAMSVEFTRPFLKAVRAAGASAMAPTNAAEPADDYRDLAARELSMLANAPLAGRRRRMPRRGRPG